MKVVSFVKSNNECVEVVSVVTDVNSWGGTTDILLGDYVEKLQRKVVTEPISKDDVKRVLKERLVSDWDECFGQLEFATISDFSDWLSEIDNVVIDYDYVSVVRISYIYDGFGYNMAYVVVEG
mgnify:CR=1 FL=1